MTTRLRLSAFRERVGNSLWFLPSVSVTTSLVIGLVLSSPGIEARLQLPGIHFVGTPEGARAVLSTVAGSMITVTGVTFSLTVVALQVASTQFTPRLLGTFLADRGNQVVLSILLSTFVYSLVVLRGVRSATEGTEPFVPSVAVALGLLLTLVSTAAIVYFFHHLTQQLRVEAVLAEVRQDTLAVIERFLPEEQEDLPPSELPRVPRSAVAIRAARSGYLHLVQLDALREVADHHGVVIRLRPTVGSHVSRGTTIAWVWCPDDEAEVGEELGDELTSGIHSGIHIASERTAQQDVAFGVRQLVDIAARALSPGVNDPTTAVASIGALADILTTLTERRLGPRIGTGEDGRVRVAVPQPTFAEILALACDQPRRYGRGEPAVLRALLSMLGDIAEVAPDRVDAEAVEQEIDETVATAEAGELSPSERHRVQAAARHARAALRNRARLADVGDDVDQPAT